MGFSRDISESIIKYGEIILSKTEEYTYSLKQFIEIKRIEYEIENIKIKLADLIIENLDKKNTGMNLKNIEIKKYYEHIKMLEANISKIKNSRDKQKKVKHRIDEPKK